MRKNDFEIILAGARFDRTRGYRYRLWRVWQPDRPRVVFVLLNPSTADASRNDGTIRRCLAFARELGCGALEVVNLFAFRAVNPRLLRHVSDPVGAGNDAAIRGAAADADLIVLGWGCHGAYLGRDARVRELLSHYPLYAYGLTRDGHPRHPLYIRRDSALCGVSGGTGSRHGGYGDHQDARQLARAERFLQHDEADDGGDDRLDADQQPE
jgi:hypothetical protein